MASRRPMQRGSRLPPLEISIGAPGCCELEFASQYTISRPAAPFQIELPGRVLLARRRYFGSVIALTRLLLPQATGRAVVLQFECKSTEDTAKAIAVMQKPLGRGSWQAFRILASSDMSFGEVVEGANQGKIGRKSPAPVELRVSIDVAGKKQPVTSPPIAGLMAGVPGVSEDTLDYEDFWGLYFSCHSHWYSDPTGKHFTVCHGPCSSGGPCSCGGGARRCWGWHFCWC
jgi:hypothetical protein